MKKFRDSIEIIVKGGDGGAGSVSFRREKYIPFGGPDGGDGGRGGSVLIRADRRFYNLGHFFSDRTYRAENGGPGQSRNCHGADGKDLVLNVPPGTQIIDAEDGELLADLVAEEDFFVASGGETGGKGNAFFKSSTYQAPKFSQPGMKAEPRKICLNLKLIADIGLVGLPNAGKSTLLSVITNAVPKIGDYPFTTLMPNLGVLELESGSYCKIADIPGIVEGAHMGRGLGLSFLRHIERVKILIFLIDITVEDPVYNYNLLLSELRSYNESLPGKPGLIVINKSDLADETRIKELEKKFGGEKIIFISAREGSNIGELIAELRVLMKKI